MQRFKLAGVCILAVFVLGAAFSSVAHAGPKNEEVACVKFTSNLPKVPPVANVPNWCEPSITSGVTITSKVGICTAGPLAFTEEVVGMKQYYVLTAGHCIATGGGQAEENYGYEALGRGAPERLENPKCEEGEAAEPWKGEEWFAYAKVAGKLEKVLIGRGGSYEYSKTADFGEICIQNPFWTVAGKVFAVTAEWNEAEKRFLVRGLLGPEKKPEPCHEGQTTGHSCGKIRTPEVPGTQFTMVRGKKLIREGGDSGGPWLALEPNKEALMEGIHSHVKITKNKKGKVTKEEVFFNRLQPALEGLTAFAGGLPVQLLTTRTEAGECVPQTPGRYKDAKCEVEAVKKGKLAGKFEWVTT